jgi:ribosomal protein S18 acetylase RimI-like enzyme
VSQVPGVQIETIKPICLDPSDSHFEANKAALTSQAQELARFNLVHDAAAFEAACERISKACDQDESVKQALQKVYTDFRIAASIYTSGLSSDDLQNFHFMFPEKPPANTTELVQKGMQILRSSSATPYLVDESFGQPLSERLALLVSRNGQGKLTATVKLKPATLLYDASGDFALQDTTAYLSDLLVHTDYRGQGIGSALLKEALKTAKAKGYQSALVNLDPQQPRLEAWYRKQGFTPVDAQAPISIRDTVGMYQRRMEQEPLLKALDGDKRFWWKPL